MSFISKHPAIVSIVLTIIFTPILMTVLVALENSTQPEISSDNRVEINVAPGYSVTYEIDEVTVNWGKQIVLVNANGRAIVYPFYQIQWMNFPEEALYNQYQLMPAGH